VFFVNIPLARRSHWFSRHGSSRRPGSAPPAGPTSPARRCSLPLVLPRTVVADDHG
jgi:hypothetical protein